MVSDRTDGQTDRCNEYVLGLPCFKKLSSESDIEVWSKLRNFDRELLAEVKEDLTHQDSGEAGCICTAAENHFLHIVDRI